MFMHYLIAVDPGLTGALAVFHSEGQLIEVIDMPTENVGGGFVKRQVCAISLRRRLDQYCIPGATAVVERVTAMPQQGVSSMLSLGDSRGTLRGVFGAMGIPMVEVLPLKWKSDMGLVVQRPKGAGKMTQKEKNERQKQAKAASVAMVKQAYPAHAYEVERAKDHNRAEAILIGTWALLKAKGKV